MSKKLTKGELYELAHDVLSSLDGSGCPPKEMAQRLAEGSAATRRDLLDVLRERAKTKKLERDPSAIVALLAPLANPGPSNKPDFLSKYVKSVFDCASALSGQHTATVASSLFMALVSAADLDAEKAKGSNVLHFDVLASIDSFVAAFDAVLLDDKQKAEFDRTSSLWLPMVPEIASRTKIPLSPGGAAALVALLGASKHDLAAPVRLSIAPLARMGGTAPQVTDELPQSDTTNISNQSAASPPKMPKSLSEVEKVAVAVDGILHRLSNDLELRLANQSKLIQRLESDHTEVAGQLSLELGRSRALEDEKHGLREQLRMLQMKLDESERHVESVQRELDKYKTSYSVAVAGVESREQDSASRVKRELVEKQLVTLRSIRDCLDELSRTHGQEKAVRQAATNFNNFARFLTHSRYTTADEIRKIEASTGLRDGES